MDNTYVVVNNMIELMAEHFNNNQDIKDSERYVKLVLEVYYNDINVLEEYYES